jgi:hypothetical protein
MQGEAAIVKRGRFPAFLALVLTLSSGCAHQPLSAPSPPVGAAIPDQERAALFERKCGLCHPANWVSYSTETREEWAKLVDRMRRLDRNWISEEEAAAITDYRSTRYVRK